MEEIDVPDRRMHKKYQEERDKADTSQASSHDTAFDTPTSSSSRTPTTVNQSNSVLFADSPKMVRSAAAGSSSIGAVGVQFKADLKAALRRSRGPLDSPVDTLMTQLLEAYHEMQDEMDFAGLAGVPGMVLAIASTFAKTHLVKYLRPDSITTEQHLEEYARLHMSVLWPGYFKHRLGLGWSDEEFVRKVLGAFILVAEDCDLM